MHVIVLQDMFFLCVTLMLKCQRCETLKQVQKGIFKLVDPVFCLSPNADIFFCLTKANQNWKYCSSRKKLLKYEHENDWFCLWPNFDILH